MIVKNRIINPYIDSNIINTGSIKHYRSTEDGVDGFLLVDSEGYAIVDNEDYVLSVDE